MKLLKYYVLMSFVVLTVYAVTDYSSWPDGEGLSEDDKKLIKKQLSLLAKKGKVAKPEKILKTMITYEGRYTKYLVAYEGGGSICAGRLTRKFNSQYCKSDEMKVMCQGNIPW